MLVYHTTNSFIALGKLVELKLEVKNYAVDAYKNSLRETNFSNYEYFEDVNRVFSDFFQTLMTVIDNVVPCKTKRVKWNTQNWFDGEVIENIRSRDKLFKTFKKTNIDIDKEFYKKAKYYAQKLITSKKQAFFDEKISESVGKPKESWNTLTSLGMPKKAVVSNFNATDNNKSLTYDIKRITKVFKDFFSNLAESFLATLLDPASKYKLESVFLYYSNFAIPQLFHIKRTSEEKVFKITENIEISKAAGIDKLPGRFLKDVAEILPKPISDIYNLSISHGVFPNGCKVAKLKPIFMKDKLVDPSNYRSISLLPLISKTIEKVVHDQANKFFSIYLSIWIQN